MAGRPIAYNREHILATAKNLFWQEGYAGTSLDKLTRSMGISKSTFYNVFKSKDDLFTLCLTDYGKSFFKQILQFVMERPSTLNALKEFYIESATGKLKNANGCFLVSAANELGATHPKLSTLTNEMLKLTQNTLKTTLELAVRKGELPNYLNCEKIALKLLNAWCGIQTINRCGFPQGDTHYRIDSTFNSLEQS